MAFDRIDLPARHFTSPRRGEVDLRSKSGEGALDKRETVTPHPNPLRASFARLSLWEREALARDAGLIERAAVDRLSS
jgi:hypothetical protein